MVTLSGKIVFITGASSGIGRACAFAFADVGARLVLCAPSLVKMKKVEKELLKKFPKLDLHIFALDVRDEKAVANSIKKLPAKFKKIDVLVNNAGLGLGKDRFDLCNVKDWDTMVDTNVKGLLYVAHAVVQGMVERENGTIINMGSIASIETYPGGNVYAATKAAVRSISNGMRIDLVEKHIRVATIEPGRVHTNFTLGRFKGDVKKHEACYEGYTPLDASDIADAAVYIASRPPHVQIAEMLILPTDQASAEHIHKKI